MTESRRASDIIRRLQPQLAQVEGITLFMQPVQDLSIEDRVSRTQYQYSIEDADAQGTFRLGSQACRQAQIAAAVARHRHRPAGSGAGGKSRDRPRHRRAAGHSAGGDRQHALRRVRPAASVHDVHAVESVSRGPGGGPALSAESRRAERHLREIVERHAGAAQHFHASRTEDFGARREPPGPVSGGDAVVQSRARCFARRRGGRDQEGRAADQFAALGSCELSGNGAGVSSFAGERAVADSRGADHGLHRARRSVRKLHSPDHDSFDASFGGRGRDSGAAGLPHGLQRDRADRHHLADRHRAEERHHDDRFRARCGAQGREVSGGGDSTRRACCDSARS